MIPLDTPKWQLCLCSSDSLKQIFYCRILQVSGVRAASKLDSNSEAWCLDLPGTGKRLRFTSSSSHFSYHFIIAFGSHYITCTSLSYQAGYSRCPCWSRHCWKGVCVFNDSYIITVGKVLWRAPAALWKTQKRMHIQEQLSFLLCLILDGLGIDEKLHYLSTLFWFFWGFLLSFTISVNATDSGNKPLCKWIYFNVLCAIDSFLQGQALIYESNMPRTILYLSHTVWYC